VRFAKRNIVLISGADNFAASWKMEKPSTPKKFLAIPRVLFNNRGTFSIPQMTVMADNGSFRVN